MFFEYMVLVMHPEGEQKYCYDSAEAANTCLAAFIKLSVPAALYQMIDVYEQEE